MNEVTRAGDLPPLFKTEADVIERNAIGAVKAINAWLADRAVLLEQTKTETTAVFLNKNGGRLTTRSVGRILARYLPCGA